jgi:hypothetical protein
MRGCFEAFALHDKACSRTGERLSLPPPTSMFRMSSWERPRMGSSNSPATQAVIRSADVSRR